MRLGGWVRGGAMVAVVLSLSASSLAKPPRRPQGTRWYGAEPHVPLASVLRGNDGSKHIETVGTVGQLGAAATRAQEAASKRTCASWARVGSAWSAVDRWGQVAGTRTMKNRDFYDVTGCYETYFPDDAAHNNSSPFAPGRIVLYASTDYRPPLSAEWRPGDAIRKEHAGFVEQLTKAVVDPKSMCKPRATPLERRTIFFRVPGDVKDAVEGEPKKERTFAVSGGCALIVAERTGSGAWHSTYLDASLANQNASNDHAYLPFAVFDMNDDGWPEIFVHESEGFGEFYGDAVISHESHGVWKLVARSPGGSTA